MFESLRNADTSEKAAQALLELARSRWIIAWIVEIVARGIPDMLDAQPQSIERIADRAGSHAETLYRVLRVLAGVGLFWELSDRRFTLTEAGRLLRVDHPLSQRAGLLLTSAPFYQRLFGSIPDILTTGESAFELEYGEPLFQHVRTNPDVAAAIDPAMTCLTNAYLQSISSAYDFGGIGTLVEVGCGHGRLAIAILRNTPSISRATLLDLPHVIVRTKANAVTAGVADRCDFVGASYFDAGVIPEGADCYLLKHVCHDLSDEDVVRLLVNVRSALGTRSRLLIIDGVRPPPNTYSLLLGMELAGLALLPAASRERSRKEWTDLVAAASLRLSRVVSTESDVSILELVR